MFVLKVEIKDVKAAVDKYEQPVVDVRFRTTDYQAMLLAKYIAQQKPATFKIMESE
jgi:hypothetical protein